MAKSIEINSGGDTKVYDLEPVASPISQSNSDGSAMQSDWNQNVPTAKDYVKGRTHYDARKTVTLTFDGNMEGKETIDMGEREYLVKVFYEPFPMEELIGSQVTLYDDGETSTITVTENMPFSITEHLYGVDVFFVALEDVTVEGMTFTKGVWAGCVVDENGVPIFYLTSLVRTTGELKKLDEKYLPDSIINRQADWNQNDETAPDYVKNRTHWDTREDKEVTFFEESITMNFSNTTYSLAHEIVGGTEISCYIDGELKCTVTTYESWSAEGKVSIYAPFTPDFSLIIDNANHQMTLYNGQYSGICKFVAPVTVGELKRLDEKYIPETIARVQDVNAALGSYITDIDTLLGGDE